MIRLDWRDASHWNNGRLRPCIYCRRPSFLLDSAGRPAHKVCTEAALTKLTERTDAA